jgi:hypothetical protein
VETQSKSFHGRQERVVNALKQLPDQNSQEIAALMEDNLRGNK